MEKLNYIRYINEAITILPAAASFRTLPAIKHNDKY